MDEALKRQQARFVLTQEELENTPIWVVPLVTGAQLCWQTFTVKMSRLSLSMLSKHLLASQRATLTALWARN